MEAVYPGAPPSVSEAGQPASHDDIERLLVHIESTTINTGYLDPAAPKRFLPRMRRLLARARIEKEEVSLLRGMLAAMDKFTKKID